MSSSSSTKRRRPRSGNGGTTTQVTFRIPTDWIKRADVIAQRLSEGAPPASRTDALRLALARGFSDLESRNSKVKPSRTKVVVR